uniref:Uncharacterized protein n=1 Tax=Arundo donax TaxID=35708 RepID=A0A0A9GMR8_ARUDO
MKLLKCKMLLTSRRQKEPTLQQRKQVRLLRRKRLRRNLRLRLKQLQQIFVSQQQIKHGTVSHAMLSTTGV